MSNLEFKVFVALFSISRLQRASPQSVRAVTVRFVLSGIVLRPVLCYLTLYHSYQDCPIDFHIRQSVPFHDHDIVPPTISWPVR